MSFDTLLSRVFEFSALPFILILGKIFIGPGADEEEKEEEDR